MAPCIQMSGVGVTFETPTGRLGALAGLDLTVEPGRFVSIVGPSGCGKTTMLKVIAGLQPLSSGSVTVLGQTPSSARAQREIGYVFQSPALLPWRTVRANVALPAEIVGRTARSPEDTLSLVGLSDVHGLYPHQLSGGMQQRVALARALTEAPQLLLLDEPFGALDEFTRESLNVELARICSASGVTAVLVTHSVYEAVFLSDEVHVMSHRPGRLTSSFEVPFERPRDLSLMTMQPFVSLTRQVRSELR